MDALRVLYRDAALGIPFRLLLMDAHLEGMDSKTLARTIQSDKALESPRLVMLIEECDRPQNLEMFGNGPCPCLKKPIKREDLLNLIQESLLPDAEKSLPAPHEAGHARPEHAPTWESAEGVPSDGAELKRRVLLVEDERISLELGRHYLKRLGYVPVAACNGQVALEVLESESIDIILMDCFMPVMDGYKTTREIRRRHSVNSSGNRRSPYIVALTARAMPGDREECLQAGMDDYVAKPIEMEDLKQVLSRAESALQDHSTDQAA